MPGMSVMTSSWVQFPFIYYFDVRVWLRQLSKEIGRRITLSEVPDSEIEKWSTSHFDAIWLMGVWQTGEQSRILALDNPHLTERAALLPDWKSDDVVASPYSIADYRVAEALGGEAALAELRKRLAQRGIKLILDFVPNHTAPDHPWVGTNREFYISSRMNDSSRCRKAPILPRRMAPISLAGAIRTYRRLAIPCS
jgi:Alpha amylase, catalytic domain